MNDLARVTLIALLVVVALPLLWGGVMMGVMGPWMMSGVDVGDRWEPWRMLWGLILMVVLIGGIGALLVWAFSRATPAAPPSGPSARDLLDARYARGELTREQYQQMRDDLGA